MIKNLEKEYIEFKTDNEADKWLEKNYNIIKRTLKDNDDSLFDEALRCYTGNNETSKYYNIFFEGNKGNIENIEEKIYNYFRDNDEAEEYISNIKILYDNFKDEIVENIILYHYIDTKSYKLCGDKLLFKKNDVFQLNKFISTSMLRRFSNYIGMMNSNKYNVLLKIKVKKGTKCIMIGNYEDSCLKEYEILLKPKTKFMVNKIYYSICPFIKVVECEIVE